MFYDCAQYVDTGKSIIPFMDSITDVNTTAKYVLLVEKGMWARIMLQWRLICIFHVDALFNQLIQSKFHTKNNCILLTGKGYPDMATRLMLQRLVNDHALKVFLITDWDPYGIEIAHIYQKGSQSLKHESLGCEQIQWIGLSLADIQNFKLPMQGDTNIKPVTCSLEPSDVQKANALLEDIELHPSLRYEIVKMLDFNQKAEVQALSHLHVNAFTEIYLPYKLKHYNNEVHTE